jgi:hypothetical protein
MATRKWTAAQRRKFKATMAARRGEALPKPRDFPEPSALVRDKALRAFRRIANVPPARGQRTNGNASPPGAPDIEGACVHLERAEKWLMWARYTGELRRLDPAHRSMIAAYGSLLGYDVGLESQP